MEATIVEAQNFKIKKQNSKMYYITFTGQYKYFKEGFYKVLNLLKANLNLINNIINHYRAKNNKK